MNYWPKQHRRVTRSAKFDNKAKSIYPPGGTASGTPSFELFESTVLKAAAAQFSWQFDDLPASLAEVGAIRHVMTVGLPWFPAYIIYGVLLSDDTVEMVDLEVDGDYMNLIADDPTD